MSQSLDVQVNSSQSFSDTQMMQGRTNIGAASQTDLSLEITNRTNADADLQTQINSKQQTLTAGLNISITNNEVAHAVPSDAVTSSFTPTTGPTVFGGNVNVPSLGVDSTGHVVSLSTMQLVLPSTVVDATNNGLMTPAMLSKLSPAIVRNSFSFSESSSADITLYTYTATAACVVDFSVSLLINSTTLVGAQDYLVRFEPVTDDYNTDYIVTGKQIGRASCRERVSSPV